MNTNDTAWAWVSQLMAAHLVFWLGTKLLEKGVPVELLAHGMAKPAALSPDAAESCEDTRAEAEGTWSSSQGRFTQAQLFAAMSS